MNTLEYQVGPPLLCSHPVSKRVSLMLKAPGYKGQTPQRLPLEWGMGKRNIRASLTPRVNCGEAARTHDLALR